jgi:hypothetical protein
MPNVVVHWPGKSVVACPDHLMKLVGLAAIMGFQVSWTPAPAGENCSNCETEAQRQRKGVADEPE